MLDTYFMNLCQIAHLVMVIIPILSRSPLLRMKCWRTLIQIILMDSAGAKIYV